jgi:rubrerythrin
MTCPLCNDTGEQRYWEGRWRDEKAENEKLRAEIERLQKQQNPLVSKCGQCGKLVVEQTGK